jgi:hypothetical protein
MSGQDDDGGSNITFRAFFATLVVDWLVTTGLFSVAWTIAEAAMCWLFNNDPAAALDRLSHQLPSLAFFIFASLAIGKVVKRDKDHFSLVLPWDVW